LDDWEKGMTSHALFGLAICLSIAPLMLWIVAPTDHAFLAGAGAAASGEDVSACPYKIGSKRYEAWQQGFEFVKAKM
jgi:hypothetical protein